MLNSICAIWIPPMIRAIISFWTVDFYETSKVLEKKIYYEEEIERVMFCNYTTQLFFNLEFLWQIQERDCETISKKYHLLLYSEL